jgi:hypothetical protein
MAKYKTKAYSRGNKILTAFAPARLQRVASSFDFLNYHCRGGERVLENASISFLANFP